MGVRCPPGSCAHLAPCCVDAHQLPEARAMLFPSTLSPLTAPARIYHPLHRLNPLVNLPLLAPCMMP